MVLPTATAAALQSVTTGHASAVAVCHVFTVFGGLYVVCISFRSSNKIIEIFSKGLSGAMSLKLRRTTPSFSLSGHHSGTSTSVVGSRMQALN